jgi:hypothetical protein
MPCTAINSLATGESATRRSRDCAGVVSVSVIKIVGGVDDVDVANECVTNVNPLPEPVAAVEPWVEWFTKA